VEAAVCIGGGGSSIHWRRPRQNIGGRGSDSRGSRTAAVEAETAKVEAAEVEVVEAEGCIGGGSMHQRHWNASEEHGGGRS
jgi:hypothetical protein